MKTSKKKSKTIQPEFYQPNVIYPVNEEYVSEKYPNSKYVGEFALPSADNSPVRWYSQKNPRRDLGHKDFFGFLIQNGQGYITGSDLSKKEEYTRTGIWCLECHTITYSRYRHDFHSCKCGKVSVDGGPAYTKIAYETNTKYVEVLIDLINHKVIT